MPDVIAPQLPLHSKMALLLHSPRAFEMWLHQRPAEVIAVGATGNPSTCPLATFLCDRLDLSPDLEVLVYTTRALVRAVPDRPCDRDRFLPRTERATYALPAWARALVRAVDRSAMNGNGWSRSVTRDEALTLLDAAQEAIRTWATLWASLIVPVDDAEGATAASGKETGPTTP